MAIGSSSTRSVPSASTEQHRVLLTSHPAHEELTLTTPGGRADHPGVQQLA